MKLSRLFAVLALFALSPFAPAADESKPVVLEGKDGAGKGKHVVLISGDQEYRSEEAIAQLAKILANRHGFKCTVLFTTDPKTGTVNPTINNIQGLEALKTADLMVIFTRFLDLPDDQMKHIAEYLEAGKPVVGLRTSTHAFNIPGGKTYSRFSWGSKDKGWEGGFGKQVLGETWVAHHGNHGKEGTRGKFTEAAAKSPIFKGIKDGEVFGTTDVYTAKPPSDSTILLMGEVTETLKPDSAAVAGKKNDPMMPVAWTKPYKLGEGKEGRAFCTTMGASQDLEFEATRRMIVNACYWAAGLEDKIPASSDVMLVGDYKPTPFRFKAGKDWQPGMTPAEFLK
ncbi:MAG: ThuA domain-containing protein [Planctomycetes bacterium]|nr:ThuA domain-containing protein [Planctomycetota bacterium]